MINNGFKQNKIFDKMAWINSDSGAKDFDAFVHDEHQLMYKSLIMSSVCIANYDELTQEDAKYILRLVTRTLQYYFGLDHVYHIVKGRLLVIIYSLNITSFEDTMRSFMKASGSFRDGERMLSVDLHIGYIYGCPVEKDDITKMLGLCRQFASKALIHGANYLDYDHIDIDHSEKYYRTNRVDKITGLIKKSDFIDLSNKAMQGLYASQGVQEKSIAIAYVNLLNFKLFNDKYGYSKGNQLLRDLANILRRIYPGCLVSRFESDHFYILTRSRKFEEDMTRIESSLKNYSRNVAIDVRAGICFLPENNFGDITHYCDNAKISADRIRHANVSLRYFKDTFEGEAVREKYIVENFMTALDKGWIKLYYQPVVRTITGKVCSMEVLARWDDPKYGLLAPGVFIGVLEEYHLIHHLDIYIIKSICHHYHKRVQAHQMVVPLSFNLSRLDFELAPIFDIIKKYVHMYDIPTNALNIEITESMMAHNTDFMKDQVKKIHEAGFKVWMDDFGSEYSSLNTLKEFEFDELKIDMKFLSEFNLKSQRIITSIVDMAKNLGIQTLAEGVEKKNQYDFLKDIGCEKVQGYYFSRPLPWADLEKHLSEQGVEFEDASRADFYDALGSVNILNAHPLNSQSDEYYSELPIGEFIYSHGQTSYIATNRAFIRTLENFGIRDVGELEALVNSPDSVITRSIRETYDELEDRTQVVNLDFYYNDSHGLIEMKQLFSENDQSAFVIHLENITANMNEHKSIRHSFMVKGPNTKKGIFHK